MSNWGEPLREGEEFEIDGFGWEHGCCGCSMVHKFVFEIRRGKLFVKTYRHDRATAQRRRYGKAELLNGEDPKWKMIRR